MKIAKVGTKKSVHTSLDSKVVAEVAAIAKAHDLAKCDVLNSLVVLGLAAHKRHAKKYVKAKARARISR